MVQLMEEFLVTYHVRFPANGSGPGRRDWANLVDDRLFDRVLKAYLSDPDLRRHVEAAGMPDYGIDLVDSETIGVKNGIERERDFGVRHKVTFREGEPTVRNLSTRERLGRFLTDLLNLPQSEGDWNIVEIGIDRA